MRDGKASPPNPSVAADGLMASGLISPQDAADRFHALSEPLSTRPRKSSVWLSLGAWLCSLGRRP